MNELKRGISRFWNFIWNDNSLLSWVTFVIVAFIFIRLIFFPFMGFVFGTSQAFVVIESESMEHEGSFLESTLTIPLMEQDTLESWWENNGAWYESRGISFEQAKQDWDFQHGLDTGDIIIVYGRFEPQEGDVIIFNSQSQAPHPIIHRVVSLDPLQTKGDNNNQQLSGTNGYGIDETNIDESQIIGKAIFRVPKIGWLKVLVVKIWDAVF